MSWRSIDESEPVVVLRGSVATAPRVFERRERARRLAAPALLAFALQRVISWSVALGAHFVLAALCIAIYLDARRQDDGLVEVSFWRGNAGEKGKVVDVPEPDVRKPEPVKPEPEAKPEPPKPEPDARKPEPEPKPEPAPAGAAETVAPKAATIGGGASAPAKPAGGAVTDKDVERDPTAALAAKRAGDLEALRRGSDKDVVVVGGAYDHVEGVLERLRVPHRVVDADRLGALDLSECKLLLVNCHVTYAAYLFGEVDTRGLEKQIALLAAKVDDLERRMKATKDPRTQRVLQIDHIRSTSSLGDARTRLESLRTSNRLIDNLRGFVEGGGYLFTSDWGLSLIEKAFPGWVKNGGNVGPKTVGIRPRTSTRLMEGVFYDAGKSLKKFQWEIDSQSYLIRIENPKVETLVESGELPRWPAVAAAFSPAGEKGGKVLHILSHFKNQATRQGDYALQSLLLNFMLERAAK